MPKYLLIGTKNVLERICGAYETHILCLTHHLNRSYGVHETFCAWHTLTASRMIFKEHTFFAWHTLSEVVSFSWNIHYLL